ncbi:MAG: hypothetical protein AAF985_06705 [Bacteroidota bacterium]
MSYGLGFSQEVTLDKNELEKRGDQYERIEAFYEEGRLVKELRYPKQEIDTLANFANPIGRWSRQTFTYALTEGDTIYIEVTEKKGKKLRMISFIEGENSVRATANKAKFFKARLPIVTTGPHSLTINNRKRIGKRFCQVQLIRYAKVVPEVYIPPAPEPEPTPVGPITRTVIDSTFNLLIDTTFRLASVLDIEHPSTIQILLEANRLIGADTTLQSWQHWIGVGDQAIAEYETLISIVPPSLGMPPGGLPLAAHMKNEKVAFPRPTIQEVTNTRKSTQSGNHLLQEQFYFTNKNTVNFYRVRLIAVGLYTSKRTEPIPKEKTTKVE